MEALADTTVLIDLWRCGKQPKRLAGLREAAQGYSLGLCWIVEAEFLRGAIRQGLPEDSVLTFMEKFFPIAFSREWLSIYAHTWAAMAASGKPPAYPDLWIGSVALQKKCPLITRNGKHFKAIPNLQVIEYSLLSA